MYDSILCVQGYVLYSVSYNNDNIDDQYLQHDIKIIRKISFKVFRSLLINHFYRKWLRTEIQWPSRIGIVQMV